MAKKVNAGDLKSPDHTVLGVRFPLSLQKILNKREVFILAVLNLFIFCVGLYVGAQNEEIKSSEKEKMLFEYSTLLERENSRVYKLFNECCRK